MMTNEQKKDYNFHLAQIIKWARQAMDCSTQGQTDACLRSVEFHASECDRIRKAGGK